MLFFEPSAGKVPMTPNDSPIPRLNDALFESPLKPKIFYFATQGAAGNEEARMRWLLSDFETVLFPYERQSRRQMFFALIKSIRENEPDLAVMEGTGLIGGAALLWAKCFFKTPYLISSGDAVGPFWGLYGRMAALVGGWYERVLTRNCAGFIGWTPYLVGRALTFGAPRGMTAPGFAPFIERDPGIRSTVRRKLGISEDAIVVGIAGSLVWNKRWQYCYGAELVRAAQKISRKSICFLIVGEGTGLDHLKRIAKNTAGSKVIFTGRVSQKEVFDYLQAMDLGSLPQSMDGVGSFRYTTKISEYLAAGLPIITGQLPFAYDICDGWVKRLPGWAPWDPSYLGALTAWLETLSVEELKSLKSAVPGTSGVFEAQSQRSRIRNFIKDLLESR